LIIVKKGKKQKQTIENKTVEQNQSQEQTGMIRKLTRSMTQILSRLLEIDL